MATVIKTSMVSLGEITYDVYLDNGAPDTGGVYLPVRSAKLAYKSSTEYVDSPLVTSKLTVDFSVRNAAEKAVFIAMVQAEELQYRLRIEREGVLWWVGFVLLDLVSEDFGGYPKDFSITATDGIARLKSIDYDPGDLPEFATIKDHLFTILSEIPLGDYYGSGDEYLRSHLTLMPEGLTPDVTISQIERLRIGYKALRTVNKKGEVTFKTYYEALEEILMAFGARLIYSQGHYVLTEPSAYATTGRLVIFHRYEHDGSALSVETLSAWTPYTTQIGESLAVAPAVVLRGKITYLPPLLAVDLTYKHYSRQNIMPLALVSFGAGASTSLEDFETDGGAGFINVSGNLLITINPPVDEVTISNVPIYVLFKMQIAVVNDSGGGQTLSRVATVTSTGVSYGQPTWIDGVGSEFDIVFRVSAPTDDLASTAERGFSFSTPVIPVSGTLTIDINVNTLIQNGAVIDDFTRGFTVEEFYVESVLAGSISQQYDYTNFRIEPDADSNNSLVLEREVLFGDGPGDNTFGRVEYSPDGTTWARTDGWRRWTASSYLSTNVVPLGGLVASSSYSLQDSERERLDISVIAPGYQGEYLFGCDGTLYLMQSGSLNLSNDEWRGRWFEVATDYAYGATTGTPQTSIPGIDGDDGGSIPPTVTTTEGPLPGTGAPGVIAVPTFVDEEIGPGVTTTQVVLPGITGITFFEGDGLTAIDPVTGEATEFTVGYDTGYVPGLQTDTGAVPYYTDTGIVWLVPTTDTLSIVSQTFPDGLAIGSYIQPSAEFANQMQALLRADHLDAQIFGFDDALTVGFSDWFWRPERRKGWLIRKVHFAFASNPDDATVKVNLKYYDATGFRYTVATHNAGGLGSVQDALTDVLEGYYRAEVETITKDPADATPEGLKIIIEVIKRLNP